MYEDIKTKKIIENKGTTKSELINANLTELVTHIYNNAPLCVVTTPIEKEYEFVFTMMEECLPFVKIKCKWINYVKGNTSYKSKKMNTDVIYIIGLLSDNKIIKMEEFNKRVINWVNSDVLEKCYMFLTNNVNVNSEIFSSAINVYMNSVIDHDYCIISNSKWYDKFNNESLLDILDKYILYKNQINNNDTTDISNYDIYSHYYIYGNIPTVPFFGVMNNMYRI